MEKFTRRRFSKSAGLVTALSYSRILGANDRVGVGFIGVGNQGDVLHGAFLEYGDCRTVAVSDLREDYMDFAVNKAGSKPEKYREYRDLLANKDVDAVVIATPDHWHALMFINACNAGKDVYIEKPFSLTVAEGRKMVDTAERTKRVVQVGIHRRSTPASREAAEFVRSGGIGQVTAVRCFQIMNEWPTGIGNPPDEKPPNEWEWDHWLGPAPKGPYNRNRMYYLFRLFYDYSGGQLTNSGVHLLDMARWCLGQDAPRAVTALGGKFAIQDNREIPDTLEAIWQFDGPTLVSFTQYNANGAPGGPRSADVELRGTTGTMFLRGGHWEVVPEKVAGVKRFARTPLDRQTERNIYSPSRKTLIQPVEGGKPTDDHTFHARNFLDCIRSRARCNCDAQTGHISTSATLIANIALKTKALLEWDSEAERFTNHEVANRMLQYEYRAAYREG